MFGKKSSESLLNQSGRSFVAETMQIEGEFHFSGAVDVAGLINGNVYGKEMIILDTGSVKGNLYVSKLNINGHVEGQIVADEISLGSNSVIKGDILFKSHLKTEEGAEIDGYIKGTKSKKNIRDEDDEDIEKITAKPEFGKPTLVKADKKEAV
ncbi:MAG: polymer-forming cytoskeletal protein [Pelagibacteraceae bacterium]|jgi:cytoskeletal protein CcmA (bactofilin family)|nr:polymer-forming cytoskeletal protein [Pelagibacteraceae bacterium]MBO6492334.1 polymer-forming cytoskeletal protein [Pelagibacteraceae bacterium]